jgi:hypothetical protein
MRSANIYNGKTKKEKNPLRRKAMNSTKLIVAAFAVTAVIIGGCSGDNRITGPGADVALDIEKTQNVFARPAVGGNNLPGLTADSQEQKIDRTSFEATLKRSEVEGGCWYLETDDKVRYTPYFEMGPHKLSVGDRILVFGYIDENMSSYCMIGPVFHVEKFTRISRNDETSSSGAESEIAGRAHVGSAGSAADEYQPNSNEAESAESQENVHMLKGYFGSTEKGCYYIEGEKGIIAELYFVQRICPNIQDGTSIVVEGAYSLLTWSPCQMAELFNVEKFQVVANASALNESWK